MFESIGRAVSIVIAQWIQQRGAIDQRARGAFETRARSRQINRVRHDRAALKSEDAVLNAQHRVGRGVRHDQLTASDRDQSCPPKGELSTVTDQEVG